MASSSSSSSETNKIILTSSDGASFELDEPVARELQIVAHMIEDDCANKAIPLPNVTGDILSKVIEYCKKHVEEEAKKKLDEWDTDFVKDFDLGLMFQLILAANYLNIKGLLELTCQSVADRIKDKSPEEIRVIFNVENDYTPEEEAEVRKQNEWAFN